MAGFFARLIEPRIAKLEVDLKTAETIGEFWEDRYKEERDARLVSDAKLAEEVRTNRTREDLLVNAALRGLGAAGVPAREMLQASPKDDPDPDGLDDETLKILEDRAKEMAEAEFGEDATEGQIAAYLADMKKNPSYWSSN